MNSAIKSQDLNFIPDDIVDKRRLQASSKANVKLSFCILIICIVVSGVIFFYNKSLTRKNAMLESDIAKYTSEIERLKDFGKQGFVLGLRLDNIRKILEIRPNYSNLIYEVAKRTPENVVISGYSTSEKGEMSINASSLSNFTPISEFKDLLLNEKDPEDNLFTDVKINSASLSNGKVDFDFNVVVNLEDIYEDIK
jgi:hypothetical protein